MMSLVVLLLLIGAVVLAVRAGGSGRKLRGGRPSERELLDAVDHEDREGRF